MEMSSLITAEYFPAIKREDIITKTTHIYSLKDISSLGSGFTIATAEIAKATINASTNEGLYRCVFPEGVTGELAHFKDGSGLLGTIVNDNGIAGQARWIPAEGSSIGIAINPVIIAIAVAVMGINKKLDKIQETQSEIIEFLHQDKESDIEANVNLLADVLEQYKFNSDNEIWKSAKLTSVTNIKGNAEKNIIFYRKEISKVFKEHNLIHSNQKADKIKSKLDGYFKYYKLSIYVIAYASFLELILGENFQREYIDHISCKISDYSYLYKVDYSKCYEQLEDYMKGSVQSTALSGLGTISKAAGNALAKVPVLSKGPVDEALISAGNIIQKISSKHGKEVMHDFRSNQDAGIGLFLENIEFINNMSNRPVEVLFDKENIYICA